jgi:hypothetical protein
MHLCDGMRQDALGDVNGGLELLRNWSDPLRVDSRGSRD